ncbi:MAG TPA: hypothetical protein VFM38_07025 [Candidatus Limnocylindrales bacterium]|nr:hypothetical protein [Candidatus Limnocylindrales bacterium]
MSIRPAVGARGSRADLIALLDRRAVAIALAAATVVLPVAFVMVTNAPLDQPFGKDLQLYTEAATRWLAGGAFYEPRQLAGPYDVAHGDVLYPPVGLWLFVPAAVLPQPVAFALWWGVPAAITVSAIVRVAPRPAVWPLIALCLAWPTTPLKIWTGNPVIWCVAAMAVAIVWRGGAPFALLKPSLFPFAFFGIRQRSWWVGLAAFVALCIPFGALWGDWLTSVVNARGAGPLYSVLEAPMLALPLAAWIGRRRR